MKKITKTKIGQGHFLCKALQKKGYSIRLSQDIVNEVFTGIKESLINKEDVYTDFGDFHVVPETRKKQRRIGLNNKPEWVYKRKNNVKFVPKE